MCLPFQGHLIHYNLVFLSEDMALNMGGSQIKRAKVKHFQCSQFPLISLIPQQVQKLLSSRVHFKDSILILSSSES